jgi:hypothetical protein
MKTNLLYTILFIGLGTACGVETIEGPGGDNPGADAGAGDGDAAVVEQDNRVTDQLQLLYKFEGAAGQTTIADVSGVGTAFDLTLADPAAVTWAGGGMVVSSLTPTIASNPNPVTKVIDACKATNEISLEAWLMPETIENTGRVMVSSADPGNVNFTLKQTNDNWEGRLRTSQNNNDGQNPYNSLANAGTATITDTHLVWTRGSTGVANFFVNGSKLAPDSMPGSLGNWDLTYGLHVANEPTLDRPWFGTIYLLAVYCKELDPDEVQQNYTDGH